MTMLTVNKYNNWLRGLVDQPGLSYHILFDIAWVTNYEHSVPNDYNRAEDGLALRRRFEYETSLRLPDLGPCRILEFLIALAIRLNETVYDYEDPNQTPKWFWQLIANLDLDIYIDEYNFAAIHAEIYDIFGCLNARQYDSDGSNGGLFPLKDPMEDQRHVEVWYQMMAYLSENV
jgi:hypothetical protein